MKLNWPKVCLFLLVAWTRSGVVAQNAPTSVAGQTSAVVEVPGVVATGFYERFRRVQVRVTAPTALAGQEVSVREDSRVLGRARLERDAEGARAQLALPLPPTGRNYPVLHVWVGQKSAAVLSLPDFQKERRDMVDSAPLLFSSFVFSGAEFPSVDFENPSLMEDVLGPYTSKTTFYDANYNRVTRAETPGRYGAVVEIHPETGASFNRYLTLYRQSAPLDWGAVSPAFSAELPLEVGVEPDVLKEREAFWSRFLKENFVDGLAHNPGSAIVLSGLHEAKPGDGSGSWNNPFHRDETWWYGLRKKRGETKPTRFLLDLPAEYGQHPMREWPLVIFLHGSGEGGEDLSVLRHQGLPKLVAQGQKFPFILVSPQAPTGYLLGTQIIEVLDEVEAKYHVDADRVYLTGLSMGGNGTWFTALEFPDRFAAIVPIAATGDPGGAARLRKLPTWYFMGGKDTNVTPGRAQQMVQAMKVAEVPFHFTLYPEAGHVETWEKAYADPSLYEWMLAQRRAPSLPIQH